MLYSLVGWAEDSSFHSKEVGGLRKEEPGLTCAFSRFAVVLGKGS